MLFLPLLLSLFTFQSLADPEVEHKLVRQAPWPKDGQAQNPVPGLEPADANWWETLHINATLIICLMVVACSGAAYLKSRLKTPSADPAHQPLLTPRRSRQHRSNFSMHLDALLSATCWRFCHPRGAFTHLMRSAVPVVCLFLMFSIRRNIAEQLKAMDKFPGMQMWMTGGSPTQVASAVLEYTFSVISLYMAMMSMLIFIWHVSAESESGLRYLLHVSGLSRAAYLLETIFMDGYMLSMLGMVVLVAVSETFLQLRMVVWSSLTLVLLTLSLLIVTSLATGYLIHYLTPSARMANLVGQFIIVIIVFSAPFAPLAAVIPAVCEQYWRIFLFPTLPAYRALFDLVAACVRGRCLLMSDVTGVLAEGRLTPPWVQIIGTSQHEKLNAEMTPPLAVATFISFALVQVAVVFGIIAFLDARYHPQLHTFATMSTKKAASSEAGLSVQSLVHRYGLLKGGDGAPVLNGVSFDVKQGEVLGLLGPNGAGKTTTIRCITGEQRPHQGSVAVKANTPAGAFIGLCPQETVLATDLTVSENLRLFALVRGANDDEAESFIEHFLNISRLQDKRHDFPDSLSGGMKRRLAVACALIAAPSVAILDEPTTGLDPMSRRGIWTTIYEIKAAGSCCLLTTHMLEEAEALCSNVVVLRKGEVVANGSVQQLKDQWGTGYMLSIDSKPGEKETAKKCLADYIPSEDSEPIRENDDGQMRFRINIDDETLGRLVIAIGEGKKSGVIRHWGISQASLEDTYLQIIQDGSEKTEAVPA